MGKKQRVYVTISKDRNLGFEGEVKEMMSRPIEVFTIFQRKTKTRVHLKSRRSNGAMEGCSGK